MKTVFLCAACVIAFVGCKRSAVCNGLGWSGGMDNKTSISAENCDDGAKYKVECTRPDSKSAFACTCKKDDVAGKTFSRQDELPNVGHDPATIAPINEACGWNIASKLR